MSASPGRNDRCPCGSGRKYKHCCGGANANAKPKAAAFAPASAPASVGLASAVSLVAPGSPAVEPSMGKLHLDRGIARSWTGDDEGALAAYRLATQADPGLAEAYGRVGEILHARGQRAEAATAYERAAAAASGTAHGLLWRAKSLAARGRMGESDRLLKELVRWPAKGPDDGRAVSEAHLAFGHLSAQAGSFEEARTSFTRAIELSPAQSHAYFALIESKKITDADRPLVDATLRRLEGPDLTPRERMMLHFAAGKAFDDLRDYASAIAQFDAANRIRKSLRPFEAWGMTSLVGRFIARYTPAYFAERASIGSDDETPVFVLGLPRSGTTLFERIVSSHPRVAGAGELTFWGENAPAWIDVSDAQLAAGAERLRRDYLRVLRGVGPRALRVTDKNPPNFMWIGLIHTLFPKARFVHCRRHPVDTCLSIYFTHFVSDWPFAADREYLVTFYRQYERLMAHWRSVIPADRFLDVDYEEATAAPEPMARRLIEFCGLPWDDASLRPEANADTIRTASRWQARQPVYRSSVERWRNYEPWLGELRELLPRA
ncbi:MAG TPA: sulfotransferase [Polyangiaceae bacterium]|jgi:tetratricopeptide (TPR) repeat protein